MGKTRRDVVGQDRPNKVHDLVLPPCASSRLTLVSVSVRVCCMIHIRLHCDPALLNTRVSPTTTVSGSHTFSPYSRRKTASPLIRSVLSMVPYTTLLTPFHSTNNRLDSFLHPCQGSYGAGFTVLADSTSPRPREHQR